MRPDAYNHAEVMARSWAAAEVKHSEGVSYLLQLDILTHKGRKTVYGISNTDEDDPTNVWVSIPLTTTPSIEIPDGDQPFVDAFNRLTGLNRKSLQIDESENIIEVAEGILEFNRWHLPFLQFGSGQTPHPEGQSVNSVGFTSSLVVFSPTNTPLEFLKLKRPVHNTRYRTELFADTAIKIYGWRVGLVANTG